MPRTGANSIMSSTFNSFWDATVWEQGVPHSTRQGFQFLLGCYNILYTHDNRAVYLSIPFGMLPTARSPFWILANCLSIPFGMLRALMWKTCIIHSETFNSFWDATDFYQLYRYSRALDFQFLLGCYGRAPRPAPGPPGALSIPFGMLPWERPPPHNNRLWPFNSFWDAT